MKRSRFTEEQIIGVLREQEAGVSTADVCRKHGISELHLTSRRITHPAADKRSCKRGSISRQDGCPEPCCSTISEAFQAQDQFFERRYLSRELHLDPRQSRPPPCCEQTYERLQGL
jgi:Transposase